MDINATVFAITVEAGEPTEGCRWDDRAVDKVIFVAGSRVTAATASSAWSIRLSGSGELVQVAEQRRKPRSTIFIQGPAVRIPFPPALSLRDVGEPVRPRAAIGLALAPVIERTSRYVL
jgi:hypothetical protein